MKFGDLAKRLVGEAVPEQGSAAPRGGTYRVGIATSIDDDGNNGEGGFEPGANGACDIYDVPMDAVTALLAELGARPANSYDSDWDLDKGFKISASLGAAGVELEAWSEVVARIASIGAKVGTSRWVMDTRGGIETEDGVEVIVDFESLSQD